VARLERLADALLRDPEDSVHSQSRRA
jgi:hypothetical protein